MSLIKQVGSSLRWSFLLRFGSQLIIWTITILVVRKLSPQDYGLMALSVSFIGLFLLFRTMGINTALVQKHELDDTSFRKSFGFLLLFSGVIFLLCFLAAPAVAAFFEEPQLTDIIRVLCIGIPFGSMDAIAEASLRRRMDFKRIAIAIATARILTALATVTFAYSGFEVWALVLGNLVGAVLRALSLFIAAGIRFWPIFSFSGIGDLVQFGTKVLGTQLVWYIYSKADNVIIGKILGGDALGQFEIGRFVAGIPNSKTGQILSSISFSSLSRLRDEKETRAYYFLRSLEVSAFFIFPACVGISAISLDLILVVLGEKWLASEPVIAMLAIWGCFGLLGLLLGSALDAVGRPDRHFYNVCISSAVVIPAIYIGTQWGIAGVAFAWMVSRPISLVFNYSRSLRFIGCSGRRVLRAISGPALASAIMYGAIALFQWTLPGEIMPVLRLVSSVVVGVLTYGLLALALNRDTALTALDLLRPKRS